MYFFNRLILTILFIIFYSSCGRDEPEGCTDPYAENYNPDVPNHKDDGSCIYDTTSPMLRITNLDSGDTINGIITLLAETQDNYVNDVTEVQFKNYKTYVYYEDFSIYDTICIDTEEPFECELNTTEDCWSINNIQAFIITDFIIGDEEDGGPASWDESPQYQVYTNNIANPVNVTSVEYAGEENPQFTIQWEESNDDNFTDYKLLKYSYHGVGIGENGEWSGGELNLGIGTIIDTVSIITDRSITSYSTGSVNPTKRNWFWVEVYNDFGCPSFYDIYHAGSSFPLVIAGAMSSEPLEEIMVVLEPVSVNNDSTMLTLTWSDNVLGSSTYQIWESTNSDFAWGGVTQYWYPDNGGTDTTITIHIDTTNVDGFDGVFYYRVDVFGPWEQEASSNIVSFYP